MPASGPTTRPPALQLAALKNADAKLQTFKDQGLSGATTKRSAVLRCLKKLRPGDVLIVWKLDWLCRRLRDPYSDAPPPRPWRQVSFAHGGN
jgi:DNA invertase Pin-like site-specific DNA recombinase